MDNLTTAIRFLLITHIGTGRIVARIIPYCFKRYPVLNTHAIAPRHRAMIATITATLDHTGTSATPKNVQRNPHTRYTTGLNRVTVRHGSADAMLEKLATESADHFGSGWGWLVLDGSKLKVTSLHDADTPAAHGLVPLLTLDVWEHAYYIDYRNERPKFLKSVLDNIVDWDFVAKNLDGKGLDRADEKQKATADA